MYWIIDTCYGQNLGLEEFRTDSELISVVLRGEEQLEQWKSELVHLQMCVYDTRLGPEDLEKMDVDKKITERFAIVLSVRYHNLQILLHRPVLEKFLEGCARPSASRAKSGERGKVQQLGSGSVETCVQSAITIISIVHTIVLSDGWRRDLLGAWNFSLFYSKLRCSLPLRQWKTNFHSFQCCACHICCHAGGKKRSSERYEGTIQVGFCRELIAILPHGDRGFAEPRPRQSCG